MFTCSCICMSLCICLCICKSICLCVSVYVLVVWCLCTVRERWAEAWERRRGICIRMQRHGKEGRVLWFCLIVDLCSQDLNLPHIQSVHRNLQYVLHIYNYLFLKERVVDEFVNVNNIRIHFYLVFSRI